jgi:xanthine/CO dehydrogenase XdhC/CoxF family maturation factor
MKTWLETREVLDRLAEWRGRGARAALATVVGVHGSAYRHEGAKLLVCDDGTTAGNVSGGCLEQDVREVALRVIRTGVPERPSYCSSADAIAAWDLGVGCEGQVDLYVEPALAPRPRERALLDGRVPFAVCTLLSGAADAARAQRLVVTPTGTEEGLGAAELDARAAARARELLEAGTAGLHEIAGRAVFIDVLLPPPDLLVIGAGEDARPLVRFAAAVGFRVSVVDRRPGLLVPERFPEAARLIDSRGDELADRVPLDPASYVVVMTHNYADDQAYLRPLVRSAVAYIGILGPRQRTERILHELGATSSIDEGRVYGPVGLDIGTDGAEQVALAVIAEILALRSGRGARSLRERLAPIHATTD